ncbi:hypothetical protein OHA72_15595 [Dactylosporangium sp. NBC_01737]|uniref:hypothetical protein n=1 Tax=Dactylosporangium sp. NBC_01737 TaxID=2975959 RepID=UPI002E13A8DD|nr:hypothetical protein OHA72_15595 [Dactylosporangium sp. NBC_01737]
MTAAGSWSAHPPGSTPERPRPAVIGAGGVFIPGHLCEPVWRALCAELARHRATGARVRPETAAVVDALRQAAADHLAAMSAHGHEPRTSVDLDASSPQRALLTTGHLAARLGISERHARRLAAAAGIQPATRNAWHPADVAALAARHEGPTQ